MDKRLEKINTWLNKDLSFQVTSLKPASQDASFRRYFRLRGHSSQYLGINSFIIMDAPPELESITEFVVISKILSANKIHSPFIYAADFEKGFILLEDLGKRTYLDELDNQVDSLYRDAIQALIKIQMIDRELNGEFSSDLTECSYKPAIYNNELIQQELDLFIDWYCIKHQQKQLSTLDLSIWQQLKEQLYNIFSEQPQVWVHRDFHSRNLMITEHNSPGVIDFQDMVWGPISYDLASIFKDCYIAWPRAQQLAWLEDYLLVNKNNNNLANIDIEQLTYWYDLTGLQRHLKVLGIFCRLNYRDNKSHYLNDLPLVENYIHEVLSIYPELTDFKKIFDTVSQ